MNAQLASVRQTETSPEHEQRVRAFGEAMTDDEAEASDDDAATDE